MPFLFTSRRKREKGFSLLEMMLATIILLVGLVAIAQLVPASILLNYRNRTDSSAMVFAQREMDFMLDQPLASTTFTDVLGVYCPLSTTCYLGNPAPPNQIQGGPLKVVDSQTIIDFSSSPGLAHWSFTYRDPNDPSGATYDIRWAVIVTGNGTNIASKRFVLSIRQVGGSGYFKPVTLDTMVQK